MRRAWLALTVALSTAFVGTVRSDDGVPDSVVADDAVSQIVDLIAKRLKVIDEVARYKWNAGMPAADPAREAALLQAMLAQAAEIGLEPEFARAVVEGQLDASRATQQAAFERWRLDGQPAFADARDLATDLRPALDQLTRELLVAAKDVRAQLAECAARARLAATPAAIRSPAVWRIAVAPLMPNEPCTR